MDELQQIVGTNPRGLTLLEGCRRLAKAAGKKKWGVFPAAAAVAVARFRPGWAAGCRPLPPRKKDRVPRVVGSAGPPAEKKEAKVIKGKSVPSTGLGLKGEAKGHSFEGAPKPGQGRRETKDEAEKSEGSRGSRGLAAKVELKVTS